MCGAVVISSGVESDKRMFTLESSLDVERRGVSSWCEICRCSSLTPADLLAVSFPFEKLLIMLQLMDAVSKAVQLAQA